MEKVIKTILQGLDERERDIIIGRFGLDGAPIRTLAELGGKYNITRERVRQIEALALKECRGNTKESGADKFVQFAVAHLGNVGGLERDDLLVTALKKAGFKAADDAKFANAGRFLMELSGKVNFNREDDKFHPFWHLEDSNKTRAKQFVGQLVKEVRSNKDTVMTEAGFAKIFANALKQAKLSETVGQSYIATSKHFMTSPFGDFGLAEWADVNPKTARDWAYVVVKKEKRPLHFTDIVSRINQFRKNKITNIQTVHNELIKDDRFVLVGRGMYGLREFGILPGTAREVIAHFIKKHGPLTSQDVVKLVLEKRFFKEGTILINLQNKRYFKSLGNGRYDVLGA